MDVIERSSVEEEGGRRVLMCEVCEEAAAAVVCKADTALLCIRCDTDIHSANPLARRQQRVPISVHVDGDVPSSFLSDHHDHNQNQNHDQSAVWCGDFAFSEEYYETDGLVVDFTNSSSTSSTSIIGMNMKINGDGILFPWINYPTHSVSPSISDIGVVPDGMNCFSDISGKRKSSSSSLILSGGTGRNITVQDREARVMRYRKKRKRKRRKFQKTIHYASRKAYAESRPKLTGRFAKRNLIYGDENNNNINILYDLVPDLQYGVIPYF